MALDLRLVDPGHLLWRTLADVAHAASGAVRPGCQALLPVRCRAVSSGSHLPGGAAGCERTAALLRHRRGRSNLVRVRLPANNDISIFMWIENTFEGSHQNRKRLDKVGWGTQKLLKRRYEP